MAEHLDVLVVGAGISGIGAGYYLRTKCPNRTFAILEAREALGGTWDLFRYPGIRSDSDMYTLGYAFRPWKEQKAIADGDAILNYLNEAAEEYGLRPHIRFQHRVIAASWSSNNARWTVAVKRTDTGETLSLSCNFLYMCSGYYDYAEGHNPDFPGTERFRGRIVHPQHWPKALDYSNQRVVIIGSGATAVTLAPEMSKLAAQVTMLQRSPTYIVTVPAIDEIAEWLRRRLPERLAYWFVRWKNVFLTMFFFQLSRRAPDRMKRMIRKEQRKALGPDYDIDTHLSPRYDPWDQRMCLVPDGDFFHAIKAGDLSIVTDTIETFTENGILLRSGEELAADLVVKATGLKLQFLAGMNIIVDGERVDPAQTMSYKAMMFSGIPNLALSFGYTNASWTLKSDLTGEYVCRLLNHMERHGHRICVPRRNDPSVHEVPFLDFSSGYIQRSLADLPKQGSKAPWKLYQNYLLDILVLRYSRVNDSAMEFS